MRHTRTVSIDVLTCWPNYPSRSYNWSLRPQVLLISTRIVALIYLYHHKFAILYCDTSGLRYAIFVVTSILWIKRSSFVLQPIDANASCRKYVPAFSMFFSATYCWQYLKAENLLWYFDLPLRFFGKTHGGLDSAVFHRILALQDAIGLCALLATCHVSHLRSTSCRCELGCWLLSLFFC